MIIFLLLAESGPPVLLAKWTPAGMLTAQDETEKTVKIMGKKKYLRGKKKYIICYAIYDVYGKQGRVVNFVTYNYSEKKALNDFKQKMKVAIMHAGYSNSEKARTLEPPESVYKWIDKKAPDAWLYYMSKKMEPVEGYESYYAFMGCDGVIAFWIDEAFD